jgi:hypothetical protein
MGKEGQGRAGAREYRCQEVVHKCIHLYKTKKLRVNCLQLKSYMHLRVIGRDRYLDP